MKVTISGFINYEPTPFRNDHGFRFHPCEMTEYRYVTVQPYSIVVEIPDDFDPRPAQISQLQAERTKVQAKFSARVTDIERQISELTSLEMSA